MKWGLNNISALTKEDMKNGEGLRTVIWFSGCSHRCPGCHNPETWNPEEGALFTPETWMEIEAATIPNWVDGITLSGGDPLYVSNRELAKDIVTEIKRLYPEKTVWCYTGYTLKATGNGFIFEDQCPWLENHDSFRLDWLDMIDVLVDGPFMSDVRANDIKAKKDPCWCGSSNQRVINVQKSLITNSIVLLENF